MSASLYINQIDPGVTIVAMPALPRPDASDPMPTVISDETCVILGYFTESHDWAIVRFDGCRSHALGPCCDATVREHPLSAHGLGHEDCQEVTPSPWIQALRSVAELNEGHAPPVYSRDRHCVITFRDAIFECIAWEFSVDIVNPETTQPHDEMMRIWKMPRVR